MSSIIPSSIGVFSAGRFAPMIFTVDTTKAGSASDTFILPCGDFGTYNAIIDWGDDSTSTITTYDDADLSHTYSVSGIYIIKITGRLPWINFNNLGDKLKITDITQWGGVVIERGTSAYRGTSNLIISATDAPVITTTTLQAMFQASSANPDVSNWDFSGIGSVFQMFRDNTNATPNLTNADFSNMVVMTEFFLNASSANPDSTNWNIPLVTDMAAMFSNSGLTTDNYDKFLNMVNGQAHQSGVTLGANGINYTTAVSGTAHANLVTDSWVITDAGGI